jgi:DNA-binding MarR family transcriptional regulator
MAQGIEVTKGAMTNTASRLAEKGYIAVRPDPNNGRGKLARLTPAGRAARNRAVSRLGRALAPLAATLPDPELHAALLTLRRARG